MNLPGTPQAQRSPELGLSPRDAVLHHEATATAGTQTLTLTVENRVSIFVTNGGACAVTLPSVTEAAGMIFTAYLVTDDGNDVTFDDNGDDTDFPQVTLKQANLGVLFYSDGIHWFSIAHHTGDIGT